jgi:hypothetical protein
LQLSKSRIRIADTSDSFLHPDLRKYDNRIAGIGRIIKQKRGEEERAAQTAAAAAKKK